MNAQEPVKIGDILSRQYAGFLAYCQTMGKVYLSDLTDEDYRAYRNISRKSQGYVNRLKAVIGHYRANPPKPKNEPHTPLVLLKWEKSRPFSRIFRASAQTFAQTDIASLRLSPRAENALRREGVHTVGELLGLSYNEVLMFPAMGVGSADELTAKLREFLLATGALAPDALSTPFERAQAAAIAGDDYSMEGFSKSEQKSLRRLSDAVRALGSELCVKAWQDPAYAAKLIACFSAFLQTAP